MLTPIELEVAIRFYWDPNAKEYFDRVGNNSHTVAIRILLEYQLLVVDFEGTVVANHEPLNLFVEALGNVRLPIKGWRMP